MEGRIQNLSESVVPAGFRGRPAWFVQLWWMAQASLVHLSPQVFYGWRRFVLRCFGAQIGRGVLLRPSVTVTYPWKVKIGDWSWVGDDVTLYSLGEITIGENTVISQGSYLCAGSHDSTRSTFDLCAMPIFVEPEVWVAARVFVGPGVHIGRGAVVGACSVVLHDVPSLSICAGNPFKVVGARRMQVDSVKGPSLFVGEAS
jgi:putative colanic acid biosynthesis acetyltransferase WcaF